MPANDEKLFYVHALVHGGGFLPFFFKIGYKEER